MQREHDSCKLMEEGVLGLREMVDLDHALLCLEDDVQEAGPGPFETEV